MTDPARILADIIMRQLAIRPFYWGRQHRRREMESQVDEIFRDRDRQRCEDLAADLELAESRARAVYEFDYDMGYA